MLTIFFLNNWPKKMQAVHIRVSFSHVKKGNCFWFCKTLCRCGNFLHAGCSISGCATQNIQANKKAPPRQGAGHHLRGGCFYCRWLVHFAQECPHPKEYPGCLVPLPQSIRKDQIDHLEFFHSAAKASIGPINVRDELMFRDYHCQESPSEASPSPRK